MAQLDLRVLIVAENLLARAGLASLLASQGGFHVVGQIAGGDSLLTDLDIYRPEVVMYDLGWNPTPAIETLTALHGVPTLALLPDGEHALDALAALRDNAAYGLLLRDTSAERLAGALKAIADGLVVVDPVLAAVLLSRGDNTALAPEPPTEDLTPREVEVLQLLAEGLPNKTIALRLGISEHTVKFHVNAVMNKLGAQSRTEAVVRATRLGLIIL